MVYTETEERCKG